MNPLNQAAIKPIDLSSAAPRTSAKQRGRIEPIRSQAEYNSIPGIEIAVGFAEALNMGKISRLNAIFHKNVHYTSDWTGAEMKGRARLVWWFSIRFPNIFLSHLNIGHGYYSAQIVVLPDGSAGVLTAIFPREEFSLTRFEVDNGQAIRVRVTARFDRHELRETGYCPPAA